MVNDRETKRAKTTPRLSRVEDLDILDPQVYLNALSLYPMTEKRNYILNFRQLMYKNMLKFDPQEKKTLKRVLMTSFGFDFRFLRPIVLAGLQDQTIDDICSERVKMEVYPRGDIEVPSQNLTPARHRD